MHALRVVPDKVIHEFGVENVAIEQEPLVVIEEFFLNGAVESFHVSIHFWSLGVGVIVDDLKLQKLLGKVFFELAAVVGEHKGNGIWKEPAKRAEEFCRSPRSMRAH